MTNNSIKHWAEDDRPREKLVTKQAKALSNAELIAILLGSGSKNESALELAKRLLASVNNSFLELSKKDLSYLIKNFKGIGEAKAVNIAAALEIGRRRHSEELSAKITVNSSNSAYHTFYEAMCDLEHEEFWALLMDVKGKLLAKYQIGIGGTNIVVADTKKIFKYALSHQASRIIVGHNHPSGDINPSTQDIMLTKKIADAGKLLDIALDDHIILGVNNYYSFKDNHLL